MLRDYSESSKQKILNLVSEVENEKLCDFTDWIGDRWTDFEEFTGQLNIRKYVNNVNAYHKKVIDKNNATKDSIDRIFSNVENVNNTYYNVFANIDSLLQQWNKYIVELQGIVSPSNGRFEATYIESAMKDILSDIEKDEIKCLRDKMVKDVGGELVFNEELIYEYVQKNPAEMTDAEQKLLIDILSDLKDVTATYEILATYGTDNLGVDVINSVAWLVDNTKYDSFTAVSAHYNEIYVNLLNYISEKGEDSNTFAASLIKASNGESTLEILGSKYSEKINEVFGGTSLAVYLAKYTTEHSEQYFVKLKASEEEKLKSAGKINKFNEYIKDRLNKKGYTDYDKKTSYYDKYGNEISKDDSPKFYKKQLTIGELKEQVSASVSLYDGTFNIGENGKVSVVVGRAEAHASVSAGFYVIGADGDRKFSPGVNAEVGASVTALEAAWEQQWFGNDMLGVNSDVKATVGKAEAKASIGAQVFDENGKLDVQLGGGASAELIGGEVKGSVGVNVLGGEVGVSGSVNYGIGAHADVGYRDGIIKCDIGASLGVGVSFGFEVDVGGIVNTVADTSSAAWDYISDGWNDFWD